MFEKGVVAAEMASLPCWFCREALIFCTEETLVLSRRWHCGLFSGIHGLQPLSTQEGAAASLSRSRVAAGAGTEEEQQHLVRRPAPWPCSDEAAGGSMATYFSSLPHLPRQRWQKHAIPCEHVEGAEQLSLTEGGNMDAGFSLPLSPGNGCA